jgi:hypothetical protein
MSEYQQTIIVKNNQASDIMIEDMGITVPAGAVINFTDKFDIYVILGSNDLYTFVSDGNLVINDGTIDLDITTAKDFLTIETLAVDPTEIEGKLFHVQLYHKDTNNGWLKQWPDGNDSGDDGGWHSAIDDNDSPFIIPYNCKLSYIDLFFKGVDYVNRGTNAGDIYLDIDLWDHDYNSINKKVTYRFTIPGTFTGNKVDNQSFRFIEPSFNLIYGSENINKPSLLGVQFNHIDNQIGQIIKLKHTWMLMTFEGI